MQVYSGLRVNIPIEVTKNELINTRYYGVLVVKFSRKEGKKKKRKIDRGKFDRVHWLDSTL